MSEQMLVVLDVGKTLAKLTLWTRAGEMVAKATRANPRIEADGYVALDAEGIEAWVADTLAEFGQRGPIAAIIPVSHGAAAVIIKDGELACPPLDYEDAVPNELRAAYNQGRDAFSATGSPPLPDGLNLGAQLHYLQAKRPELFSGDAQILPWAQYWSWRLSGAAHSEITSLGCHSDLWLPLEGQPSEMARRRGWAERFAPLAKAGEVVGRLSPEWAQRTGLASAVKIYCGIHDSNAALLAARAFEEIAQKDSTVLSTGTWFVAMRTPAPGAVVDLSSLPEGRDCLVNVDAFGQPVPSARFMGGREIEILSGVDTRRVDIKPDQPLLVAATPEVVRSGARVLPTFAPGFGPFPDLRGRWVDMPTDSHARRAAVCLYVALVADVSLDLIGARGAVLVEGRFAEAKVFVRALASLRPDADIYVSNAHTDVSYGALRLIEPDLRPVGELTRVAPLDVDLSDYRTRWRHDVERGEVVH